jgi:hypothetical protein
MRSISGYSFRGPLEGVGPENQELLGSATLRALPFQSLSKWFCPHTQLQQNSCT